MEAIILQEDVKTIEARVRQFEERTGCELLLIVAKQSDEYPAAPFRFGLVASFLFNLVFSHYFEFQHAEIWPVFFALTFLLFTLIGRFSHVRKFALADWEVNRESREKAIELFHTQGTSKVGHQVTAMIMVSVLERQIHVLVDRTLKEQISQQELDDLVLIMQKNFRSGDMALGFTESITSLEEKILKDFGGKVGNKNPNELKDAILFL
ncbi:MAG: hypothetical protein ACJ76H_08500 [Bacteriovoracaceae bacterium]